MGTDAELHPEESDIVLDALRGRHSVGRVRPERPPRQLIERIIEAAGWAPNHYRTEPWRFTVVSGDARQELGDVMAESARRRLPTSSVDETREIVERERRKPLRAPVIIAVAAAPSTMAKVVELEEIAAVAAGVQNMLLAAHALGLGAMWRTGQPAYDPAVKRFLGFPESAHLLSFVYVGYPDLPDLPERKREARRHASWLGWGDESAG